MSFVSVDDLKSHIKYNGGSAEDNQLQLFIDSAEETFTSLTGRTLDTNATTGFPTGVPSGVKLAILLLSAHYYRVRATYTDQDMVSMPFGFVSVCRRYSTKFVSGGNQ